MLFFATDTGLHQLQEHGKEFVMTDGTFCLFRDAELTKPLILWTLMVRVGGRDGPGVPCAYLITNGENGETYKEFLSIVKEVPLLAAFLLVG